MSVSVCVCACVRVCVCENSKSRKSLACSSAGLGHGCVLIQRTVGCDHTVPTSLVLAPIRSSL